MSPRGIFTPPGDKSISHRIVLAALLAEGEVSVYGLCDCEDVKSSLSVFKTLGGEVRGGGVNVNFKGLGGRLAVDPEEVVDLDCGNSGTTIRLLSGILAGRPGRFLLDGDQQLRRRPMERLADPLRQMGAEVVTTDGRAPIKIVGGSLHGIEYVNSDGSAQLKSAVILATMSACGSSKIIEPIPTRDHTERLLNLMGAKMTVCGDRLEVFPGSLTLPQEIDIPGDPSSAAYFLIGAAMIPDSSVTARDTLLSNERIGFLKVLDRMGASISISMEQEKPEPKGQVTVEYAGRLSPVEISREEVPSLIDEIPMLALAAATAEGVSVFRQVRELRLKETDRLTAIKHQLGAIGVRVKVENDYLFIEGPTKAILPETRDSIHDHRLAMMLHMAALAAGHCIPVLGDESLAVSYPGFRKDLDSLPGKQKSDSRAVD
mgnify:CR=1 FL=1